MEIILTGHGNFSEGLKSSIEIIMGEAKQVHIFPFENDKAQLQRDIEAFILGKEEDIICMADLAGGTPFNVCGVLSAKYDNVNVIGGVNLPILLTGLMTPYTDAESYMATLESEGKSGITIFKLNIEKETEIDSGGI